LQPGVLGRHYTAHARVDVYTDTMPELPEIQVFKRYFDATSLRQTISGVRVTRDRILRDLTPRKLAAALKHQAFCASRRHGKYLAVALEDGQQLVLHFGMTGCLHYVQRDDPDTAYARMIVSFDNGHRLDYDNKRMLGRIRLVPDFNQLIEQLELGPDALGISLACFEERLRGHHGAIKSTLMDQVILAGLGNTYTDEILFQARIHPATPADLLTDAERRTLHRMMQKVLRKAIDVEVDTSRLPRSYLIPRRQSGAPCPRGNGTVHRTKVAGRSAYFCPACQVKRGR
jgi:formamidopyrimidine-DNA glycosylase